MSPNVVIKSIAKIGVDKKPVTPSNHLGADLSIKVLSFVRMSSRSVCTRLVMLCHRDWWTA